MKPIHRKVVYDGFFRIEKLTLKQGNKRIVREQFERGDGAAALVYDRDQDAYVFVKQYRVGAEKALIEVVAGSMSRGEDPAAVIRKEIMEETGYRTKKLSYIHSFYVSPGACTEKIHLYYAEVGKQVGDGGGVGDEHIQVVRLPAKQLSVTDFEDAKSCMALMWLRLAMAR